MQQSALQILACPVSKTSLEFKLVSHFDADQSDQKIKDGVLYSETGFVFPVIDGIPRMLIESIYDYQNFLKKHVPDFSTRLSGIEKKYVGLLNYCIQKNKKTKKSFEFEWNLLRPEKKDLIWHDTDLKSVLLSETGKPESYFTDKMVADVGCGHGLMTSTIASISQFAVGIELSKAVEKAYRVNKQKNILFIQGDLQFLPFVNNQFEIVYSSGVIHHTNNTELSLSLIEMSLKSNGLITLWLYHPQKNKIHNLILFTRKFFAKIPLKIAFILICIFVFPFSFLIKKIKRRKKINYREELIDLVDGLTPEFRFETEHDVAENWLQKRKYTDINITTTNQFGFSITGIKKINDINN